MILFSPQNSSARPSPPSAGLFAKPCPVTAFPPAFSKNASTSSLPFTSSLRWIYGPNRTADLGKKNLPGVALGRIRHVKHLTQGVYAFTRRAVSVPPAMHGNPRRCCGISGRPEHLFRHAFRPAHIPKSAIRPTSLPTVRPALRPLRQRTLPRPSATPSARMPLSERAQKKRTFEMPDWPTECPLPIVARASKRVCFTSTKPRCPSRIPSLQVYPHGATSPKPSTNPCRHVL